MKRFCTALYFVTMAVLVLSLSGCGGSSTVGGRSGSDSKVAQSKRMIITSPALKRGGTYSLFRGNQVAASSTTAQYYIAPASQVSRGNEDISLQLEFSSAVSEDLPFIITESDDKTVIFAYNPKGTSNAKDTTTTGVTIAGGTNQKLAYSGLTLSTASVKFEDETDNSVIDIVLSANGTATVGGETAPVYDLVWHVDPQHPEEYWTEGISGTTVLYGDSYDEKITSTANGVYIARDVRYTPDTLNFTTSQTAKKDQDTEYVVYYDATAQVVRDRIIEIGNTYGTTFSKDTYILATLPSQTAGMGGNPPDGQGGQGGQNMGDRQDQGQDRNGQGGQGGGRSFSAAADSSIAAVSTMTHSATDAYKNPVLHITTPGTYRLTGKWHGQIWIETPKAKVGNEVGLILNGVEVSCDVAPALVFYKVYKWAENGGQGYDTQSVLAANDLWKNLDEKMKSGDYYTPGAVVEIADGTTNTFTGANVYRLLNLCPKLSEDLNTGKDVAKYSSGSDIGTNISAQDKMYKLDGAFHSRRTMVIGGGTNGTGSLIITSTTCEGLDAEMHMLVTGGNITVTAPDDGINVNEDNVSVFVMNDGNLKITSTGGDGIDSNGWVSIKKGTLNITAGTQAQFAQGEAGIDAENGVYIADGVSYTWTAAGNGTQQQQQEQEQTRQQTQTYNTISVEERVVTIGDSTFTLFPSASVVQQDTEGDRNIPSSGRTFPTVHKINDFSGIAVR